MDRYGLARIVGFASLFLAVIGAILGFWAIALYAHQAETPALAYVSLSLMSAAALGALVQAALETLNRE